MKYFSTILFAALIFACSAAAATFAQESGGVKGKVRTTRNEALAQVSVTARQDGKDVNTVKTGARGEFLLDGLRPGTYNFAFDKDGFSTGVRFNVEIKKNKIRDLGDRLVLSADQGIQVVIMGTVFDEAGRSVRGANIEIEKKQGDGTYRKVSSTTSSYGLESLATGEFVFRFPQGDADFRITASMKGASASKEISVSSAAIYRTALTLKVNKE